MCFGCQCPESIPAPSPYFQNLRLYLKIMACGFLLFAIFNFIIQYIIGGIYSLILIYFLYIGWARFDACSILLVFVFSLVQTVQYLIIIISMIEHKNFFPGGMGTFIGVVVILSYIFYTGCIFVTHWAYRYFKNFQMEGGQLSSLFPGMPMGGMPSSDSEVQEQPRSQPRANNASSGFNAFSGQAVRVG